MPLDGEIIGVGNVVVDITDLKEAEDFRSVVVDNMAEGLYTLDTRARAVYERGRVPDARLDRRRAAQGNRCTSDPLPARRRHSLPAVRVPAAQVRTQGRAVRITDEAFTRKDGTTFPVAYSSAPLRIGQRHPRRRRRVP